MDRYSRIVALLKVILPLAALALLSIIFLISRGSDQEAAIPFAQTEIEERMRGQQITAPFFAGSTEAGDEILVSAQNIRRDAATNEGTSEGLYAVMRLSKGGKISLRSDLGSLEIAKQIAHFSGDVLIQTYDGTRVETELLDAHLDEIFAVSPTPITATGIIGTLSAGAMQIHTKSQGKSVHILFNKGVKLVYDPKQPER